MSANDMNHMTHLETVARGDVAVLREKESTYQGSWKRAGGRSAWFMARRNMDRLISMLAPPRDQIQFSLLDLNDVIDQAEKREETNSDCTVDVSVMRYLRDSYVAEDIFAKIEERPSGEDGTVLACMRDLRRYFILIEAEMIAESVVNVVTPCDVNVDEIVGNYLDVDAGQASRILTRLKHDPRVRRLVLEQEEPNDPKKPAQDQLTSHALNPEWPWAMSDHEMTSMNTGKSALFQELSGKFYKRRAKDLWVLESVVESIPLLSFLRPYYHLDQKGWIINIDKVPANLRCFYETLRVELNAKEHGELPEWQKDLYGWHEVPLKYILLPQFIKWSTEEE